LSLSVVNHSLILQEPAQQSGAKLGEINNWLRAQLFSTSKRYNLSLPQFIIHRKYVL